MNGFILVGLLGVAVLAVFLWIGRRHRRTGGLPLPDGVRPRLLDDRPAAPARPVHQPREGGDGGGNG